MAEAIIPKTPSPLSKTGQSDSEADPKPLKRLKNIELRSREYLLPDEIEKLLQAAKKKGRYGQHNATPLLMMYRHGLRVSEAIALRWSQVDLKEGQLHVRRLKNGKPSVQRLAGTELRSAAPARFSRFAPSICLGARWAADRSCRAEACGSDWRGRRV
jgi:integrase